MEVLTPVLPRMSEYVSHYERHKNKDDNFVYMESGRTWDKVYELVKEEINEFWPEKKSCKVRLASTKKLRSYFLMLKHTSHKKVKCNICSILTILGHTEEREAHHKRAENFQNHLAKDSKTKHCFIFDLQQVQPLLFLWVSKAFYFYHRQTWLFNLDTNNTKSKRASMYIWIETTASRGSREITSCFDKFLKEQVLK